MSYLLEITESFIICNENSYFMWEKSKKTLDIHMKSNNQT